jgi:hypothetical protein
VVQILFARESLPKEQVLECLRDPAKLSEFGIDRKLLNLDASALQAAQEMASRWSDDPTPLNQASWQVVRRPSSSALKYSKALWQAEAACRVAPDNGLYVNTLGVAQYRMGKFEDSIVTLKRSDKLNSGSKAGRHPADLAFLATAHCKLGRQTEAESLLGELKALMKKPMWANNDEAQEFLKEAEAVLAEKQ